LLRSISIVHLKVFYQAYCTIDNFEILLDENAHIFIFYY